MALSPLIPPAQIVPQLTTGVKSTPRFCDVHSKRMAALDWWRLRCQRFRLLQCGAGVAASADSPQSTARGSRDWLRREDQRLADAGKLLAHQHIYDPPGTQDRVKHYTPRMSIGHPSDHGRFLPVLVGAESLESCPGYA